MAMTIVEAGTVRLRGQNFWLIIHPVTFSGTYPANGELLNLPAVSKATLRAPKDVKMWTNTGYWFRWVPSTSKMLFLYADYNNAADGPLIEFPAGAYPAAILADTSAVIWAIYAI